MPADIIISGRCARFLGRRMACSIGRGGLILGEAKREGDGCTPRGAHRITGVMYRADRIACPGPGARRIGRGDLWSDDPGDPRYNQPVRAPHRFSHEALRRADRQYDLVLITGWNRSPARPGRGSAIFLHRWRRPGAPTAGCIGLSPRDLAFVARNLRRQTRLRVL